MRITIIGTGNVAWHLCSILEEQGHTILEIFSRDLIKAKLWASKLYQAKGTSSLDFTKSKSEIFILAVKDESIVEIANKILLPENGILVHTSGTIPLETIIEVNCKGVGVFYPLQSLKTGIKTDWNQIPICLEANNENTDNQITTLAESISNYVYYLDSEQRKQLHLAAVFVNNFSNLMMTIGEEILEKAEIPFEILHPLISETCNKAISQKPSSSQTGPASRNDQSTLEKHHILLYNHIDYQLLYKICSEEIMKKHNLNKF